MELQSRLKQEVSRLAHLVMTKMGQRRAQTSATKATMMMHAQKAKERKTGARRMTSMNDHLRIGKRRTLNDHPIASRTRTMVEVIKSQPGKARNQSAGQPKD